MNQIIQVTCHIYIYVFFCIFMTQLCLFMNPPPVPLCFISLRKFGEVQTTGEFVGLRAFQYLTGVGDPGKGQRSCVAYVLGVRISCAEWCLKFLGII